MRRTVQPGVTAYYANPAKENVNSVSAGAFYKPHTDRFGEFGFRVAYNDILKHTHRDRPGSELRDDLRDPEENDGFKTTARASISWHPNRQWRTRTPPN